MALIWSKFQNGCVQAPLLAIDSYLPTRLEQVLATHLVDNSILINLRRAKRLGRLTKFIQRGRIAVPDYTLKRLEKSRSWKVWVEKHRASLRTTLYTSQEAGQFARLLGVHGTSTSNPRLSVDDIMAIAIAICRGLPLAIRDTAAERVASELGVRCLGLDELLRELEGRLV